MERKKPKISVIAPVFGVEKFIERSAESMMCQTLDDVEFIFVDDCTKDKSIEILNRVISRYPNRKVCILHHKENLGLPAARNTGLEVASGNYIFHWDSDDYAEPEMLASLYQKAVKEGCDYIWSDWYLTFRQNSRIMPQPSANSPREALSIILSGGMKYNVWNKLVSRKLYQETGIRFPSRYSMGEDMTMIKLLAKATRVGHVNKPFYHYIRTNEDAMTQTYSEKHLSELRINTEETCQYLRTSIPDELLSKELNWFKLNVKLPFLFSGRKDDIKLWQSWYPETNIDIMSNKRQALRTRLIQWSAANNLWVVNIIYNSLVLRFIYGVIYR